MKKTSALAAFTFVLLFTSGVASADTVSQVWSCKLNEGKTSEDAHALNAKWLKWARDVSGSDAITSTFVTPAVGDVGGFMWVDSFPDFATWAKLGNESTHMNPPTSPTAGVTKVLVIASLPDTSRAHLSHLALSA